MKTVFILRGLPGSGKSTLCSLLLKGNPEAVVCSADSFLYEGDKYVWTPERAYKAHRQCQEKFQGHLALGFETIIVDNTNTKPSEYQFYTDVAKTFGYNICCLTVGDVSEESIQTSIQRNGHSVPEESIRRMANRFHFGGRRP